MTVSIRTLARAVNPKGFTGSQGAGFTGSQGAGFTGSQGAGGYTGSQGTVGGAGFTGSQGVTGYVGSVGDLGYTGSQGVGYTGSSGADATKLPLTGGTLTGVLTGATNVGNVIPFYYANQAAFPSATTYHGAIAHSHADGKMYQAHGGVWNALANESGNVATATALQTSRNINGTAFNGTANITVTAAASTLTSATLASGVTASSLTSVGTLATLTVAGTTTIQQALEKATISATAATGVIAYDALTQAVLYYTSNATANWTPNIRGNGGTTLNSTLAVGQSITVAFMVTQGATAYYASAHQIDGVSATPKWQGGTAPTTGNTNGIDAYTYTIIKTAATPTYVMLAAQTQFK